MTLGFNVMIRHKACHLALRGQPVAGKVLLKCLCQAGGMASSQAGKWSSCSLWVDLTSEGPGHLNEAILKCTFFHPLDLGEWSLEEHGGGDVGQFRSQVCLVQ